MPRILFLLLLAALAGCAGPRTFYLGGIQVNEADHSAWVDRVASVGFNTIATTVYARQGDWDSANLWWEDDEPAVVSEIRTAKARGMNVVLVLRVALDHAFERNRFLWHGMIMPRTEPELREWFERYRSFAEKWARIAGREGVDVLALGSEMSALSGTLPIEELPPLWAFYLSPEKQAIETEVILGAADRIGEEALRQAGVHAGEDLPSFLHRRTEVRRAWATQVSFEGSIERINQRRSRLQQGWLSVIAAARAQFPRTLSYAANFDHYQEVGFWKALDSIGINAYFPLRSYPTDQAVETSALRAGWTELLTEMQRFRVEQALESKPFLFTELGYTRRRNATVAPWAMGAFSVVYQQPGSPRLMVWGEEPEDLLERARALEALHEALQSRDPALLCGILYWKLSTYPGHIKEEPFVLVLSEDDPDPLQSALSRFSSSRVRVR